VPISIWRAAVVLMNSSHSLGVELYLVFVVISINLSLFRKDITLQNTASLRVNISKDS